MRVKPPIEGVRSLPSKRNSESGTFHSEQKGQNLHLISQPAMATFFEAQLARLEDWVQGSFKWYQRCWHGIRLRLSSATHILLDSNSSGDVEIGSRRCEPAFGQVIGALGRRGGWTTGEVGGRLERRAR